MPQWNKLGRLYEPQPVGNKLLSHAANPLAVPIVGDIYRVFYSGRDAANRSSVGFVDIDIIERAVVGKCSEPAFTHGPDDSFYSHGVSVGTWYEIGGKRFILFMGWQQREGAHWRGDIGRLQMDDDRKLHLSPAQPFMGSDEEDPISLSYPWVTRETDGAMRMWYGSTLNWDAGNGEMLHVIKSAVSADGVEWRRTGLAVPYEIGVAQAFSRPTVLRADGGYHMWFSVRSGGGESYRIGYAASLDGDEWEIRMDDAGIAPADTGWDSEMIEYPCVFTHRDAHYMLYNGNGYGRSGFGLAQLEAL